MTFIPIIPTDTFIARSKILKGGAVKLLWKNFVRPCKSTDRNILGVSAETKKKGDKILIFRNLKDLQYKVSIKTE